MELTLRTTPRLPALEPEDWDTVLRERILARRPPEMGGAATPVFNIFKTLANHPRLAMQFAAWGGQLLLRSTLPVREREFAILRTGWLCGAAYEWQHHVAIGRNHAGLTEADFERIKEGPAANWNDEDRVLLTAVDELVGDHFLSDPTWAALERRFSREQLMDLVFLVGNYTMVSMALNSFGVALEPEFNEGGDK